MQTGGMQQPVEGHDHKDHHKRHEAEAAGMPPTNGFLCILCNRMISQYQVQDPMLYMASLLGGQTPCGDLLKLTPILNCFSLQCWREHGCSVLGKGLTRKGLLCRRRHSGRCRYCRA